MGITKFLRQNTLGGKIGLFGKESEDTPFPERYIDPKFTESQDMLFNFGKDGMSGKFNDYYAPIGQWGGKELDDIIAMNTNTINRAADERNAAMGIRSTRGSGDTARAIGDMSTQLRYSDYLRALGGRQSLLNTSLNTVGNVRDTAKGEMSDVNAYNFGKFNYEQAQKAAKDAQFQQLISTGLQLAGTVGGFMIGGPAGAAAGSQIGGAVGNSMNRGAASSGFVGYGDIVGSSYMNNPSFSF